jgi:hypothetical protein
MAYEFTINSNDRFGFIGYIAEEGGAGRILPGGVPFPVRSEHFAGAGAVRKAQGEEARGLRMDMQTGSRRNGADACVTFCRNHYIVRLLSRGKAQDSKPKKALNVFVFRIFIVLYVYRFTRNTFILMRVSGLVCVSCPEAVFLVECCVVGQKYPSYLRPRRKA